MDPTQGKRDREDSYLDTLQYLLRVTKRCAKNCKSLKLEDILGQKDLECLSQNIKIFIFLIAIPFFLYKKYMFNSD